MSRYSVYVLKAGDFYKIGYANNFKSRLAHIQTGCPFDIEVVKLFGMDSRKVAREFEARLHKTYEPVLERGEWYRLSDKDVADLIRLDPCATEKKTGPVVDYVPQGIPKILYLKDAGRVLKKAINDSPYTVQEVADGIGYSRRSMYLFFKKSNDMKIVGSILDFFGLENYSGIDVRTPKTV